jgi:hypothetical protein
MSPWGISACGCVCVWLKIFTIIVVVDVDNRSIK